MSRPTYEAAAAAMEESHRVDPTRPWRVVWGFGAHQDFATEVEAQAFYEEQLETQKNGWQDLVCAPFNATRA